MYYFDLFWMYHLCFYYLQGYLACKYIYMHLFSFSPEMSEGNVPGEIENGSQGLSVVHVTINNQPVQVQPVIQSNQPSVIQTAGTTGSVQTIQVVRVWMYFVLTFLQSFFTGDVVKSWSCSCTEIKWTTQKHTYFPYTLYCPLSFPWAPSQPLLVKIRPQERGRG